MHARSYTRTPARTLARSHTLYLSHACYRTSASPLRRPPEIKASQIKVERVSPTFRLLGMFVFYSTLSRKNKTPTVNCLALSLGLLEINIINKPAPFTILRYILYTFTLCLCFFHILFIYIIHCFLSTSCFSQTMLFYPFIL